MAEIEKYIYGIMNSNATLQLGSDGVYTIPYRDVSVVAKDCEVFDYASVPNDIGVKMLLKHQEVVEKIMDSGITVIPVKLGTFVRDEIEIQHVLNRGYTLIKEILDKISDRIEIDVAVIWNDFSSLLKGIGEEREIKEMAKDDRVKVGEAISRILGEKREEHSLKIHSILNKISEDTRAHDVMDDKMILNSAFLVNKNKLREFEEEIESLNIKFDNKLDFKCICPLPPYSFWTLEIKRFQFEEINLARNRLVLSETATKDEIKKAYQRRTSLLHPDKNPGKQGLEKEFNEVVKAYKVLLEYCDGETCSFTGQDFKKNALLIRVK